MRELRSAVNAFFFFALFLLVYAAVTPGHATSSTRSPRFLRMQIEDLDHNPGKKVTVSVPYFFVGNVLRVAALGRLHREMEVGWHQEIEAEELNKIWEELKAAPEGQEVVREHDHETIRLKREGQMIVLHVDDKDGFDDAVKIRFPVRLMEAAVSGGSDFDVDALISELRTAKVGDLVEVDSDDARVKVWIE